jgi:hypothetical protein
MAHQAAQTWSRCRSAVRILALSQFISSHQEVGCGQKFVIGGILNVTSKQGNSANALVPL